MATIRYKDLSEKQKLTVLKRDFPEAAAMSNDNILETFDEMFLSSIDRGPIYDLQTLTVVEY